MLALFEFKIEVAIFLNILARHILSTCSP